jgi:hypothetical protein
MPGLDYVLPAILGICLAAAAGFRIFVPLLMTGLAARFGYLPVGDSFAWIATLPALVMLSVAALVEVAAYYLPGIDNLLDALATPMAVVAGIALSAAVMTDLPPMLKWTLAIIAGGGAAALTQSATAVARGHSTVLTGGFGNAAVATGELLASIVLPLIAIVWPVIALVLAVAILLAAGAILLRLRKRARRKQGSAGL